MFTETIDTVFRYEDVHGALRDDIHPLFGEETTAAAVTSSAHAVYGNILRDDIELLFTEAH